MRLTWVQPEDLVGHELRQAAEDGRWDLPEVRDIAARWHAAGGHAAPPRAGASPEAPPVRLRRLAEDLLDRLAAIPSPLPEPSGWNEIVAACPAWPARGRADRVPDADPARVLGAWQGRAAGCVLGKPVEKIPREGIREIAEVTGNWPIRGWFTARGLPPETARRWPWNRRSAVNSLAENIDGIPEDDDLNFALLALAVLERHGRDFTTGNVAQMWLDELPGGRVFTAERVAYRNLLTGIEPEETATYRNPFREWIGALIRADVYGWANPGDPATAAEFAWRDARLSHTANGVYGAMFTAAMCARSLDASSVTEVVEAGLSVVPAGSRLAAAVRDAVAVAGAERDFERVVDHLHARHGHLHWVHTINNAALIAAVLVHGGGDFTASIAGAVAGGWDTDSAGATVGSIAGALNGGVPGQWSMKDRLTSSITGFDGIALGELARRTRLMAG
ncbi:ADP-ribosylglycohydrolase family protein [Microtetraspora sp. AC03309]|uniref:ADP-ribosylglycohydrolase family protein n=1 Tax=Microtetraspora sp. AC03309 TaxID=2779376 RepID=UPI001E2842CB|nr:ADP-ribosylglycohydrolase family protein [Microtetraspora sp. AC03309]MCC5580484.1 ADP-ribosylglycohydrolase family protein [Microtetraspora sp. AC03309]